MSAEFERMLIQSHAQGWRVFQFDGGSPVLIWDPDERFLALAEISLLLRGAGRPRARVVQPSREGK